MPSAEQHPDGDATPIRRPAKISTDQWSRLEPLLDALLDAPPEERPALLDSFSAGDDDVRRELHAFLAECERELPIITGQATERFAAPCDETGAAFPQGLTDRYQPGERLARGGMATVYKARDVKHGRDVAVKVVHPAFIGALGREHFLREIAIAAHLHHPHIVPLYDSGETDRGSLAALGRAPRRPRETRDCTPASQTVGYWCDNRGWGPRLRSAYNAASTRSAAVGAAVRAVTPLPARPHR